MNRGFYTLMSLGQFVCAGIMFFVPPITTFFNIMGCLMLGFGVIFACLAASENN